MRFEHVEKLARINVQNSPPPSPHTFFKEFTIQPYIEGMEEEWSRERSLRFLEDLTLEDHGTQGLCPQVFHGTWGKTITHRGSYCVTGDLY